MQTGLMPFDTADRQALMMSLEFTYEMNEDMGYGEAITALTSSDPTKIANNDEIVKMIGIAGIARNALNQLKRKCEIYINSAAHGQVIVDAINLHISILREDYKDAGDYNDKILNEEENGDPVSTVDIITHIRSLTLTVKRLEHED